VYRRTSIRLWGRIRIGSRPLRPLDLEFMWSTGILKDARSGPQRTEYRVQPRKRTRMPTKIQYLEMLNARLALWNAELDELQARAGDRADLKKIVAELCRLRDDAAERTRVIERAGDPDWELLAANVDKEFEALGDAFGRARTRFGE